MAISAQESTVARIDVPSFHSFCGSLFHFCLYTFVIFFVVVAIYNLTRFRVTPRFALAASMAWLCLIGFNVYSTIRDDGGIRRYFVNRLAEFSRHHFIEADSRYDYPVTLRLGYEILSRRIVCFEIKGSAVTSVDWSTGQATMLAGHDVDDWYVTIWYNHADGPQPKPFPGMRQEEAIRFIGGSGPRDQVDAFGQTMVTFLQKVGVVLKTTDSQTEFTLTGKPIAR